MEVIGNIHDLRDSVKLGREICRLFSKPEPELEEEVLKLSQYSDYLREDTVMTIITKDNKKYSIGLTDDYYLVDGEDTRNSFETFDEVSDFFDFDTIQTIELVAPSTVDDGESFTILYTYI
jgi:hypothetical protein